MMKYEAAFDISPRVIKVLGEELIHHKKIAIAELVKNAYDADAEKVKITIGNNRIVIEDNGCGMNTDIIRNYWLKPGSSPKRNGNTRTPIFKRLPLGEKGIGRLGVHRLGKQIKIFSKTKHDNEAYFEINWKEIEESTTFSEIPPIIIEENVQPREFKNSTGTKLIIEELRETFDQSALSEIKNDLLKILSPFQGFNDQFQIELYDNEGLFTFQETLTIDSVLKSAFFYFEVKFKGDTITNFTYKLTPPENKKISSKELLLNDTVRQTINLISAEYSKTLENEQRYNYLANSVSDIGTVTFKGYIFEPRLSQLFQAKHSKELSNYLKENGGIRVYRDGIRIYNYGEGGKDSDILNLDRKRSKRLGNNIGYNQILASIELDRETSRELIEKTNREGFIHNRHFLYLQQKLDLCMEIIIHYRKLNKAEMEPLFGKRYDKGDIDRRIKSIISTIEKLSISNAEKTSIHRQMHSFSEEFKHIKDIFLTASNTGLNMTFIVHEIEKIMSHLEEKIKHRDMGQIEKIFLFLKDTISSYKDIIRIDKKNTALPVSKIIKQAIFNSRYRFDSHKIELIEDYDNPLIIHGKKGLIIGIINNLFDNAIYWLAMYKIGSKKILIKSYREGDSIVILIADNGKGFNIGFEAALGPFITGRFDDSSMGIGLFLTNQVMEGHNGSIEHGDKIEDALPEDFTTGAIIKLKFPKEL